MSAFLPATRPVVLGFRFDGATLRGVALGAILVVPTVIAACALLAAPDRSAESLAEAPPAGQASMGNASLLVRDTQAVRRAGFITVTGTLTNHTRGTIRSTEAVVELVDGRGAVVGVDSAVIEAAALAPGEASSFQVVTTDAPTASAFRVHFRRLLGDDLPSRRAP